MKNKLKRKYDVIILGAGQAGLCLARQLLLYTKCTILHLEKNKSLPGIRQKVGESTVQIAGFYLSKVLDMEEYLCQEHFMKYNLRFLWKTHDSDNRNYEDHSQAYIRNFSNIASYQLDRNLFESKLLELNKSYESRYTVIINTHVKQIDIRDLNHSLEFVYKGLYKHSCSAKWLIDSTGKSRFLSKRKNLNKVTPINHNANHFWIDGIINIEKLTTKSKSQQNILTIKKQVGHLPVWLATNHFMGEGYWFWVIPIKNRTSFGLVYDPEFVDKNSVNKKGKLLDWISKNHPSFKNVINDKSIIDFTTYNNFSYDCRKTLSSRGWALTGMSGRFNDPLYSPGADTISIQNCAIIDLIKTKSKKELDKKSSRYELLFQILFNSFLPTYHVSYNALGDQESFILKYTWELSIYFNFFVFPFINNLFTNIQFLDEYFKRMAQLGPLNHTVQTKIKDFSNWKNNNNSNSKQTFFDLMDSYVLKDSEKTFYELTNSVPEAMLIVDSKLELMKKYALLILCHVQARKYNDNAYFYKSELIEKVNLNMYKKNRNKLNNQWEKEKFSWGPFDPEIYFRIFNN